MKTIPATILTLLSSMLLACSRTAPLPGELDPAGSAPPVSPAEEFRALAERLQAGDNIYVGRGSLDLFAKQVVAAQPGPLQGALQALVALSLAQLRHGEVVAAEATMELAFERARSGPGVEAFPFLLRSRALVHLRRAELQNCVARHNPDCCIFPLAAGGVHTEAGPATLAAADYERFMRLAPNALAGRWLLNLSHMALGQYPASVPKEFLIPPSAFESEIQIERFNDVAPMLGLDLENLCGGVIADDFDGDGLLDIVTSTFAVDGPLAYFHNTGTGTFEDRSEASGLAEQLGGLNCIGADYDNDGDVDILVMRGAWLFADGHIRNSLLQNDGTGSFRDVTYAAGLAEPAYPSQAATFGDFDNDGDLDLFIGNESVADDEGRPPFPSQYFVNQGDGTFVDQTVRAGLTNDAYCKAVCAGDYDNDGDLDLFVSNIGPNRLYRNDGDGSFTDVAAELGLRRPERSFASWFFDYDNDGLLDLFVVTYEASIEAVAADYLGLPFHARYPALYRNRDGEGFDNVTVRAGLDHAYLPMGANFGDIDNDGFLDIYLGTGDPNLESLMPNRMLLNQGGKRFVDVTFSGGLGHLQKGHGIAFADFDQDGDQDIYHQLGGFYPGDAFRNALFENPGNGAHFVVLELIGVRSNRSGFGARIRIVVTTAQGERSIHRAVGSVSSFGGSPRRQEIGLGAAKRIERVEVFWPASGQAQSFTDIPLDAHVRITEGQPDPEISSLQAFELGSKSVGD